MTENYQRSGLLRYIINYSRKKLLLYQPLYNLKAVEFRLAWTDLVEDGNHDGVVVRDEVRIHRSPAPVAQTLKLKSY